MIEPLSPEDRDALAGELALGLLEGEEFAAATRLRLSDPAFAEAVDAWSKRFEPLAAGFAESPPPDLWPAIERRLAVPGDDRLRRALGRWRLAALAGGALAASLAAAIVLRPPLSPVEIVRAPDRTAPIQTAIAQLGGEEAPALLAVNYDPAGGLLRIRAVRLPESRLAPELWVIPADGVPRSLGLVASDGSSSLAISASDRRFLQDGATLAITLEPRDGGPHRAPSSAPIAAGKISTI